MDEESAYMLCLNDTELQMTEMCKNNTRWLNEYPENTYLESIVSIVVPICFGFIGIIGLVGNALVVIVVFFNPGMRSTTNLLIINLAIADLLFIIFCIPFTATDYVLTEWPFGDTWCKIVQYLIAVTAHASVYTLVLMSLDRFLAVVHPIASMSVRTESNALLAISFLWVVILTTILPVAFCHGEKQYTHHSLNQSSCIFLEESGYSKSAFQIWFFLSSCLIPLVSIMFLYMCMLLRLWKSAPGGRVSAESKRGKKRVTRMVVIVVAVFAICWFPIQVILLMKSVNSYKITMFSVTAQIISHVLAYMNSCINPVLYAFLSENFRIAFRKVMYCRNCIPYHNEFMPTKTTRTTGNGSCHDIV